MSDNRTWQYEPEAGSAVANICEYEGARCIRFVCEFIDPPSAEDAALMIAGKNEVAALRAELAELRARVPAICFPRQPNGEGGWVIDANYVAAIHKDCFPIEWQPCEEEVEAVLLAVERAAPVTPAAVPEDVAKDAEISDSVLLKAYTTASNGEVLSHSWRPIYLRYARIGIAAILAADTEGRKDE